MSEKESAETRNKFFYVAKIFLKKKKNTTKNVLITSFTILLPATIIFSFFFFKNAKGGFISFVNFLGHSVHPSGKAVNLNREVW